MNHEEAKAWLRGERSTTNMIPNHPYETWRERIARTDAAMIERAYWIVKAHKEGLVSQKDGD